MSSLEENKALVLKAIEVSNRNDFDELRKLIAPDLVDHAVPAGTPQGFESLQVHTAVLREGFPDYQTTIDMLITEGDKVVLVGTGHGTHRGNFIGFAPTNREVSWLGMRVYRIADGKIAEAWGVYDRFGILQQLGVLPPLGQG